MKDLKITFDVSTHVGEEDILINMDSDGSVYISQKVINIKDIDSVVAAIASLKAEHDRLQKYVDGRDV